MGKRKKTSIYYTLMIPGIFMAVLGFGNVLLGTFKYQQYQEVLIEDKLEYNQEQTLTNEYERLSPLQRLKTTDKKVSRDIAILKKAEARRDLYSLVIYGGKVFLLISALLLIAAIIRKYYETNKIT